MTSRVATWRVVTFCRSTTGVAPVTVTVSSTAPTRSWTSTFAANPVVNPIRSRTTVLKPVSVKVTLYVPGRSSTIWYRPAPSVKTVRTCSISAGLRASTVTPGRTLPVASVTVPPMEDCALAAVGASRRAAINVTTPLYLFHIVTSDQSERKGTQTPQSRRIDDPAGGTDCRRLAEPVGSTCRETERLRWTAVKNDCIRDGGGEVPRSRCRALSRLQEKRLLIHGFGGRDKCGERPRGRQQQGRTRREPSRPADEPAGDALNAEHAGRFESGEFHPGTSGAEKSRDPETESTQSSLRPPSLLVISLGVLGVLGV